MTDHRSRLRAALLGAAGLALGGCDAATAPPSQDESTLLSREISLPELGERLAQGPQRVEIELLPGGDLVAREVEIHSPDELDDREALESRIVALEGDAAGGALVLALGDLRVTFGPGTRFREDDEGDLSAGAFVERVAADLAAGRQPAVEAKRRPPAAPQDPDDPRFAADEIRLEDEDDGDEPEIEMNVDGDNLLPNDVPPPDAWIQVLGLRIEIRAGVTEIEAEDDALDGEIEFEGGVASVDLESPSFTLDDGTVVRILGSTRIENDDDDDLPSLARVAEALDAGRPVTAEGEGVLESSDPRIIAALQVEFEIDDDDDADDEDERDDEEDDDVPGDEFEGSVAAVDLSARTFTLSGGLTVRVTDETIIAQDGDLLSLEAVAEAVGAGRPVRAEGSAEPDPENPETVVARTVKFEVDD